MTMFIASVPLRSGLSKNHNKHIENFHQNPKKFQNDTRFDTFPSCSLGRWQRKSDDRFVQLQTQMFVAHWKLSHAVAAQPGGQGGQLHPQLSEIVT